MQTSQTITAISGFVSAALTLFAAIDPGSVLSQPTVQTDILAVFGSGTVLFVALWSYLHHQAALSAGEK